MKQTARTAEERRTSVGDPFHYTASGLPNVWLFNGFVREQTPYGAGVRIEDADGLHAALAYALATDKQSFADADLRYLRKHMRLSQKGLARLLGCSDQTVARWEKGKTDIDPAAERLVRLLTLDFLGKHPDVADALTGLAEPDAARHGQRRLRRDRKAWKLSA
jgi:putative transcriptional regulator